MEITSLDNLLEGIEVVKSAVDTFTGSLETLVSRGAQAVSYTVKKLFLVNNIGILEINNEGLASFDYILVEGDIISDITSNVSIDLRVGSGCIAPTNRIVMTNSNYTEKRIRFYLNPQALPDRVELSYKVTVLDSQLRKQITIVNVMQCDNLVYSNGMALVKLDDF